MPYKICKVPAGDKISIAGGKLQVPDQPIVPFIEGDGTGADIWRGVGARPRRRRGQGVWRQEEDRLDGSLRRRKSVHPVQLLAARRNRRGLPRVPGRHQGPAHHAHRRRHSLAQRRPAADARSLRLPAPGPLVQGRAVAGQESRQGRHGHLPRKHRGHLRRHRIRSGLRGGQEVPRALPGSLPQGIRQDSLPGHERHRHQAGLAGGHGTAGPLGPGIRHRQQAARA